MEQFSRIPSAFSCAACRIHTYLFLPLPFLIPPSPSPLPHANCFFVLTQSCSVPSLSHLDWSGFSSPLLHSNYPPPRHRPPLLLLFPPSLQFPSCLKGFSSFNPRFVSEREGERGEGGLKKGERDSEGVGGVAIEEGGAEAGEEPEKARKFPAKLPLVFFSRDKSNAILSFFFFFLLRSFRISFYIFEPFFSLVFHWIEIWIKLGWNFFLSPWKKPLGRDGDCILSKNAERGGKNQTRRHSIIDDWSVTAAAIFLPFFRPFSCSWGLWSGNFSNI